MSSNDNAALPDAGLVASLAASVAFGGKMHWRSFQDREFLGAWSLSLDGGGFRKAVLTIRKVTGAQVHNGDGRGQAKKAPVVWFEGLKKGMVLNSTNGKSIEGMYGPDVEGWYGNKVELYVADVRSTTGGTVKGLRVSPKKPKGDATADTSSIDDRQVDEAMRAEQTAAAGEGAANPEHDGR